MSTIVERLADDLSAEFGIVKAPSVSLMLFITPHRVRMDLGRDCILPETELRRYRRGTRAHLPALSLAPSANRRAPWPRRDA